METVVVDVENQAQQDEFYQQGMKITFQSLSYVVDNVNDKGQKLSLLKDVNGYFLPGQMAALMGPSGSGKTTLLDVLAGRKTQGDIQGSILYAGQKASTKFLRRYTGYVEQFDTLLDKLTVQEMFMYTAELKRAEKEPIADKRKAVQELIDKLALSVCKDTVIGNQLSRGISGGQAKRTNIGIALISNPRVLFLDEPTSGLDSYTANEVMTVVKNLVQEGVTICATIHSPSAYTFALFDRVLILVRGQTLYFGENGASVIGHFNAVYPEAGILGVTDNDAERITDIVVSADRSNKGPELAQAYLKSDIRQTEQQALDGYVKQQSKITQRTMEQLNTKRATTTSFLHALVTMIKYRAPVELKDGEYMGGRIGDKLIFSFVIFTAFLGIGDNFNEDNLYNILGALFMWCTLPAFGAAAYVPAIVIERATFVRERNDGLYRVITYLTAKMVQELALAFIGGWIFGAIVFYALQLQGSFPYFALMYFSTLSVGISLGYLIAALCPTVDVANAALPAYVVTLLFFAGLLIRLEDIPNYWGWYSRIDFLRYAFTGLTVNQFEGVRDEVLFNGEPILDFYGIGDVDKWGNLGAMWVFFLIFYVLGWLTLSLKKYANR